MARRHSVLVLLAAIACCSMLGQAASAHQLNVFATAEGATIRGQAYYRGGVPVRQAKVAVLDPAEKSLGETTTDDEGRFTFQAKSRTDHRLVVDGGQGHSAEFTIQAAELPATLAVPAGSEEPPEGASPKPVPESPPACREAAPPPADLSQVQAQIGRLQQELDALRHQTQFRDVLGGIGYIVGMAGIAFYFLGVRQLRCGLSKQPDDGKA